jgi:hypothetical protein
MKDEKSMFRMVVTISDLFSYRFLDLYEVAI